MDAGVRIGNDRGTRERESTVTFLLVDVEHAYVLRDRDPDLVSDAFRVLREVLTASTGAAGGRSLRVPPFGCAYGAVFSSANDAAIAAADARTAFDALPLTSPLPSGYRLAMHTGDARVAEGEPVGGESVRRCARILGLARGGQVVVSAATAAVLSERTISGHTFSVLGTRQLGGLFGDEQIFGLVRSDDVVSTSLRERESAPTNIPVPSTAIIGREAAIGELQGHLRASRLVTVTGSGGCGKTRVALAVAATLLDDFTGGVWWTDLSAVRSPDEVWGAVARACGAADAPGLPVAATVESVLASRKAVLVLDGCEHVIDAAAHVVQKLLDRCRSLSILASSREALGLSDEVAFRLPSLSRDDAIDLFAERARRVRSDFELGPTLNDVAAICERLDGIPLAIELAAARVRSMSPAWLSVRLEERFRLLTGGDRNTVARHRTLSASIDWSYDLLDDAERAVLRRLGVFCAAFTIESAQVVAADGAIDGSAVVDLVGRLVAKHLVVFDGDRYRLLDTIRLYAVNRAGEAGELESARRRHGQQLALRVASVDVCSRSTAELRRLLDPDGDDLGAAAEWMLVDERPLPFEFFRDLGEWLWRCGRLVEARNLVRQLSELRPKDTDDYVVGFSGLAFVAQLGGAAMEPPDASALRECDRSVASWLEASVLRFASFAGQGDVATALEACGAAARNRSDDRLARICMESAAVAHSRMGRFRKVRELVGTDIKSDEVDLLLSLKVAPAAAAGRWQEVRRIALDVIVDAVEPWVNVTLSGTIWAAVLYGDDAMVSLASERLRYRRADLPGLDSRVAAFNDAWLAIASGEFAAPEPVTRSRRGGFLQTPRAFCALERGDLGTASRYVDAALAGMADDDVPPGAYLTVLLRGWVRQLSHEDGAARASGHHLLRIASEHDIALAAVDGLELLSVQFVRHGNVALASRLIGAAQQARDEMHFTHRWGFVRAELGEVLVRADASLVAEGRTLTLRDAVDLAHRMRGERNRTSRGWSSLSPTETKGCARRRRT